MSKRQYSLRGLFGAVSIVGLVLGGIAALHDAYRTAVDSAVRSAYYSGRITVEEARDRVGEKEFDSWHLRQPSSVTNRRWFWISLMTLSLTFGLLKLALRFNGQHGQGNNHDRP